MSNWQPQAAPASDWETLTKPVNDFTPAPVPDSTYTRGDFQPLLWAKQVNTLEITRWDDNATLWDFGLLVTRAATYWDVNIYQPNRWVIHE